MRKISPGLWIGLGLLGLFVLMALFGGALAPYPADAQNLDRILEPPTRAHLLGTDENGCDLLSQLLYGARLAALISTATVLVCLLVGTALGTIAGYLGGPVDEIIMRLVDVLLAFPGILLNLAIVALAGRPSAAYLVFALCINGWVGYARLARGQALALRDRDFVVAARAVGCSPARIMLRHVAPNLVSPILVQATFGFAGIILVEASLSFLGLGPPQGYSWGALLNQGTTYLWRTWHLATVPGCAIALVVLGCNLLGDGLRDRLDPKQRARA